MKIFTLFFFLFLFSGFLCAQKNLQKNRFTTADIFTPEQIKSESLKYGSAIDWKGNNNDLDLLLLYPDNKIDNYKKRPVIMLVHGGSFTGGSLNALKDEALYFARKGYAAFSINYRLGWSKGCNPNDATATEAIYRATQDAKAALRFIISNADRYNIDTGSVFLYGTSAGAIVCLLTTYATESSFEAEAPGISKKLGSLDKSSNELTNTFSIKAITSLAGGLPDTSLINSKNVVPIIMFQGTSDITVPYGTARPYTCQYLGVVQGSSEIKKRMETLQAPYELCYQPGKGHGQVYKAQKKGLFS